VPEAAMDNGRELDTLSKSGDRLRWANYTNVKST